jgi:DNA modification methylase
MIFKIGNHRLKHGDIMDGLDDLMQGEQADLMYSDPPWGQGNLKYWYTMNRKQTGQERIAPQFNRFIDRIFCIASQYVKGHVFLEYGLRWKDEIKKKACLSGLKDIATITMKYRSGSKFYPLHLHVFSRTGLSLPDDYIASVTGTHGYQSVRNAIKPFARPGLSILDPCCGLGYTAQMAKDAGMVFYGNELNLKRLKKTIARLEK